MTCAGDQEVDIPIGAYRRALNRGAKFDRAKEESGFLWFIYLLTIRSGPGRAHRCSLSLGISSYRSLDRSLS